MTYHIHTSTNTHLISFYIVSDCNWDCHCIHTVLVPHSSVSIPVSCVRCCVVLSIYSLYISFLLHHHMISLHVCMYLWCAFVIMTCVCSVSVSVCVCVSVCSCAWLSSLHVMCACNRCVMYGYSLWQHRYDMYIWISYALRRYLRLYLWLWLWLWQRLCAVDTWILILMLCTCVNQSLDMYMTVLWQYHWLGKDT